MPQSLANIIVHLVFSTLDRQPLLEGEERMGAVYAYLGGISAKLDCPTIAIGGMPDHVHILARLSRTLTIAERVKEMKRASTLWIREQWPDAGEFHWQAG